jgi:ribose 5-phosphate isomerase B
MKIFLAADHRGYALKKSILEYLQRAGYDVEDVGSKRLDPNDDFPVLASRAVSRLLSSAKDDRAILICGSGQGMMIAANRYRGIRAGLGWSLNAVREIRQDEDSNVLALPAEIFNSDKQQAYIIIEAWLTTEFNGASRYVRRNLELDNL